MLLPGTFNKISTSSQHIYSPHVQNKQAQVQPNDPSNLCLLSNQNKPNNQILTPRAATKWYQNQIASFQKPKLTF